MYIGMVVTDRIGKRPGCFRNERGSSVGGFPAYDASYMYFICIQRVYGQCHIVACLTASTTSVGGITEKGRQNSKLYSTNYWKQQRITQLSQKPLCASCLLEGKVVQATVVDHIFPHRQDENKFKLNHFQSLCIACHTNKTIEENNGKYLYYSSNGIITYTDLDYGKITYQTEFKEDL